MGLDLGHFEPESIHDHERFQEFKSPVVLVHHVSKPRTQA